ncbi:MAG TPA: oxalyl-CoA decarboxylase [Victivallales bacterium]|nr:oxalyl-CoA decarboxylase [Victivallales bacterium]
MENINNKATVSGYSLVANELKTQGIKIVYGIMGIPVTQLAYEIQKHNIRYIGMRNEQAASIAAGAAGYLTQVPGVCLTVAGPGFTNALAGLANATENSFPMILISGSSDIEKAGIGQGDFQEFDQITAAKPYAKSTFKANTIAAIGAVIARAVRVSTSGRPGGVYVELPTNVLHETITEINAEKASRKKIKKIPHTYPSEKSITYAANLLKNAKKPLIVIGKGAAYSKAEKALKAFVEQTEIPFIPTPMAKGLISDNHEYSAVAARSLALGQVDVAILIGGRLNWILQHGTTPKWNTNCKFIQIDICEDEMDSNLNIEVPIVGDACNVINKLLENVKKTGYKAPQEWQNLIKNKVSINTQKMDQRLLNVAYPMNFTTAFGVVKNVLTEFPETMIVNEGANTLDVARTIIPMYLPRKRLDTGSWGTMGVGMPYSIAAATNSENLVLAIEGDAAFGFSGMEIEVICRYKLPVIILIMNNGGIYKGDAKSFYKGDPAPACFIGNARYDKLIEAFGGKGYNVDNAKRLRTALKEALAEAKPALINCTIDPHAGVESGHLASHN